MPVVTAYTVSGQDVKTSSFYSSTRFCPILPPYLPACWVSHRKKHNPGNWSSRVALEDLCFTRGNYFPAMESETVRRARPFARRRARTLRPSGVAIRARKPCLLTLFLFEGWNVLFISVVRFLFDFPQVEEHSYELFLRNQKTFHIFCLPAHEI